MDGLSNARSPSRSPLASSGTSNQFHVDPDGQLPGIQQFKSVALQIRLYMIPATKLVVNLNSNQLGLLQPIQRPIEDIFFTPLDIYFQEINLAPRPLLQNILNSRNPN